MKSFLPDSQSLGLCMKIVTLQQFNERAVVWVAPGPTMRKILLVKRLVQCD
ncbi:Inositol 1,4,5-Trisphosphate Receptor Type 2 [Manis pentadactyla]|nr:Inositol 1,4,5-Trisphosphate Receptor Type 2 [Manis pentadactyla]